MWTWLKEHPTNGGPPNWAWCITWGIMIAAIIFS